MRCDVGTCMRCSMGCSMRGAVGRWSVRPWLRRSPHARHASPVGQVWVLVLLSRGRGREDSSLLKVVLVVGVLLRVALGMG